MKKVLQIFGLGSFLLLCNCGDDGTTGLGADVTGKAEIATYHVSSLMMSGLSSTISTSISENSEDNVNVTIGNSTANCSVSGTADVSSITYKSGSQELAMTQTFSACKETISDCNSTKDATIDGSLAIGVVGKYNLITGTAPSTENTVITTSGTLAFSGSLTGACIINLTTTVVANTIDTKRTAAENYQYIMANSTGTICGKDVKTLSADSASYCSGI